MNAVVVREFGGPEVLKLEKTPDPIVGPDSIVVRLRAVGVNPVDTYIRSGTYAFRPELPYVPGSDAAGEIESFGERVHGFTVGQRVYLSGAFAGTYAEKALCGPRHVHPLPDVVSYPQGAALNVPYVTAYRALFQRAAARAGETVLVHGATGGVGVAAIQLAAARGLRVLATGGSDEGRAMTLAQGATTAFDHSSPGYMEAVLEATDGKGVDVIVEMRADLNLQADLTALAPFGRIAIVGNRGRIEIDPRSLMRSQGAILGVLRGSDQEIDEAHAAIQAGLVNGTIRPVVGKQLPLAEAARAHEEILALRAIGKVVLI